jgi:response regulator RpfG family c-di-GMP phosphodiesterase
MLKRYVLRHKSNRNAYIEKVVAPARLSEWTGEIEEAQLFEIGKEAEDAAKFIEETAFAVEAVEVEVDKCDYRIANECRRRQKASNMVADKYGLERFKVEIIE